MLAAIDEIRGSLKDRIPAPTRDRLRRAQSRLRWVHKYRRLRQFRERHDAGLLTSASFVLLDPEVENFTYEIANESALGNFLAGAIGAAADEVRAYMREGADDAELNAELTRRVRWRWDTKRRLPLGRRLGWYALVRALRPRTVVETGIHAGLGSLTILRALARNRAAGSPGCLISFDLLESSGWLVPERLRADWLPCFESTYESLDRRLVGERVDLLFQDLGAGYEAETHDYETVSRHAASELVIVGGSAHLTTALRDFATARGLPYHHFVDRPRRHVFPGMATAIVCMGRA